MIHLPIFLGNWSNFSHFLVFLVILLLYNHNYMPLHAWTIVIVTNRDTNRRRWTMFNYVKKDDCSDCGDHVERRWWLLELITITNIHSHYFGVGEALMAEVMSIFKSEYHCIYECSLNQICSFQKNYFAIFGKPRGNISK